MDGPARNQNFIGLQKAGETFLFFYHDEDRDAVLATIARFASNPELVLDWTDASILIREVALTNSPHRPRTV